MTSKVGIVLLLPVILASVFAVLRIKTELTTISQLNTAGEQARIIRPMLDYSSAANQLAVTAASGGPGTRGSQQALDQDAAHFDQSLANLQAALQVSKADKRVTTAITNALAAGRTLRENRNGTSPTQIGKQADEVATHIDTAITALPTPKETAIERYYVQMGVIAIARQMFTQEQLWILSGELSDNPALISQALLSAGGESATIHQYAAVYPESADRPDVLLTALQTRVDALNQNSIEPVDLPGVADSLRTSSEIYTTSIDRLVDLIDASLRDSLTEARGQVLRDVAVVVVTLLAGLALALAVARSLVVPVRRLRRDALQVAHEDLPAELAVVRKGGATPEIVPVDVQTTEEIGQLARAVDDMHRQALHLAADQARLRLQISSMFETLSRRSQSLVEQQLTLIEDLERDEDDSGRLQSLFRLDHLATRMRRNGDNLLVLAGTALRRGHLPPVPLSDMLWSAVSQVEDYQRVEIGSVPDGIVAGEPAVDIEHLLAELIDNSLRYSPPSTPVAVSVTRAVDGGYLIEITDRGLGMSGDDLTAINERLASGGEVTVETARRMGLFVVGRLAKRHTITVSLRRTSSMSHQSGVTASVHLPGSLVAPAPDAGHPVTATFTPPTLTDEDSDAPQRYLSAVPSPQPEAAPFGTTSAGLPQRRPAEPAEPPGRDDDPADFSFGTPESESNSWSAPAAQWPPPSDAPILNMWADPEDEPAGVGERGDTDDGDDSAFQHRDFEHRDYGNRDYGNKGYEKQDYDNQGYEDRDYDDQDFEGRNHEDQDYADELDDADDEPGLTTLRTELLPRHTEPVPPSDTTESDADPHGTAYLLRHTEPDRQPDTDTTESDADPRGTAYLLRHTDPDTRTDTDTPDEPPHTTLLPRRTPPDTGSDTRAQDAESPRTTLLPRRSRPDPDAAPQTTFRSNGTPDAGAADAEPSHTGFLPRRSPHGEPYTETPRISESASATAESAPQPAGAGPATPIYQRMVSEWLVEPSSSTPAEMWASPADAGWAAAAGATRPATADRTSGGLPIRRPGAQLVPGGLPPSDAPAAPDPEEIRNNLSRHLSGVRSGRADAQYNDDGGLS
ncbi:HAMP domain-containing sensor histidine kinase [Nocardia blacklockiae]|uniref:HAMP domain-containing sensor histidine kinase n=1 Tax=Nocardia blacklockiae TaxID=480036 RepID=UPI002B4AF7E7|nr:ATP-binding protein [Nocardia blacklockiae]